MIHTTTTKITTRDDRQYRKVTCSCGHLIITTDSKTTAENMALWHTQTPECTKCQHRNVHEPSTGCTYLSGEGETCLCIATVTT